MNKKLSKVCLIAVVLCLLLGVFFGCKDDGTGGGSGGGGSKDTPERAFKVDFVYNGSVLHTSQVSLPRTAVVGEGVFVEEPDATTIKTIKEVLESGKIFVGWFKDENFSTLWNFETDLVTENIRLYADFVDKSRIAISTDGAFKEINPLNPEIDSYKLDEELDNSVTMYNFDADLPVSSGVSIEVYTDKDLTKSVTASAAPLANGENVFYVKLKLTVDGLVVDRVVSVTIVRAPVYTVSFVDELNEKPVAVNSYPDGAKIAEPIVSRKGYTLIGWKHYIGGQSNKYWNFEKDTVSANTRLCAVWEPNVYKVTLDPGDEDGLLPYEGNREFNVVYGTAKTGLKEKLKDKSGNIVLPKHEYGEFDGWFYGETRVFDKEGIGEADWTFDEDVTLTAKWNYKDFEISVKSGNENMGAVVGGGRVPYRGKVTIKAIPNEGFAFVQWIDSEGSPVSDAGVEYQFDLDTPSDRSFTAVFKEISATLKIDYLYDTVENPADVTIKYGKSVKDDIDSIVVPARADKKFVGWAFSADGAVVVDKQGNLLESVTDFWNDGVWIVNEDEVITLTAKWDDNFSIKILTSDAKAGTISSDMSDSESVSETIGGVNLTGESGSFVYGKIITINEPVANTGYTFDKWVEISNVGETDDLRKLSAFSMEGAEDIFKNGTITLQNDLTLVAIWNYKEITVNLNVNGGNPITSGDPAQTITSQTVYYNQGFALPVPSHPDEHYLFGGWVKNADPNNTPVKDLDFVTDEQGGCCLTDEQGNVIGLTAETGVYAYWKAVEYTVDVSVKDGVGGSVERSLNQNKYAYNTDLTISVGGTDVGYKFAMWEKLVGENWTKLDGVGETYSFIVDRNITIRCVFVPIVTDITFDSSTFKGDPLPARTLTYGKTVEEPFPILSSVNHFYDVNEQYEFLGWYYVERDEEIPVCEADGLFKNGAWNIDSTAILLKAKWRSIFKVEGGVITGLTDFGLNKNSFIIPDSVDGTFITGIGERAFAEARNIKSITISTYITSIGEGAFAYRTELASVEFAPNCELKTVETDAFKGCTALTVLDFPKDVSDLKDGCLSGCTGLTKVTLNGAVALAPLFGTVQYDGTYRVSQDGVNYYLPDLLTTVTISETSEFIAENAYKNCKNITTVTFERPQSVSVIGDHAFENCSGLKTIGLENVKKIGAGAFARTGLENTVILAVDDLGVNAFQYSEIPSVNMISSTIRTIPINAFAECRKLKTVTMPSVGVTTIADNAFNGCVLLESVNGSLDSVNDIRRGAFADSGVTAAIANRFTSIKKVGAKAFENSAWDNAVTSGMMYVGGNRVAYAYKSGAFNIGSDTVSIADGAFENKANVTGIVDLSACGNLFYIGEKAFKNTAITELKTHESALATIATEAFYGCNSLSSANVTAKKIGVKAFYNCYKLATLTLSDNVGFLGMQAFSGDITDAQTSANTITKVELPIELVDLGDRVFENSRLLTSVDFAIGLASSSIYDKFTVENGTGGGATVINYNGQPFAGGLTKIGAYAFAGTAVTKAEIPFQIVTIGNGAFANCESLTKVAVYKVGETEEKLCSKLEIISANAFENCKNLTTLVLYKDIVKSIGAYAFDGCEKLESLNIPGVTNIPEGAFSGCMSLNFANNQINKNIQNIGGAAFKNCTSLTNVILNSVQNIGDGAFYGCNSLTTVTIEPTVSLRAIGSEAFAYTAIASISIPTMVETIGAAAFAGCTDLISVSVDVAASKLETLGSSAFQGCRSLVSFTVPEKLNQISANTFEGCTNLTTVVMHDGVTGIDNDAFGGCTSLSSLTLSRNIETIEDRAFKGCSALTTITLPTATAYIGSEAFADCGLTEVVVRENVKTVEARAFAGNAGLTHIAFMGTTPPMFGNDVLEGCALEQIHVPSGCGDAYKAALPEFASYIRA